MSSLVRINHADAVMDGLRGLVPSELPALVFTSLAALSVPVFSDRCQVFIDEEALVPYRIERPITTDPASTSAPDQDGQSRVRDAWSGQWVSDHAVRTSFIESPTASAAGTGFRGTVVHLWNADYRPTGTDIALAQLLVDHAIRVLRRERADGAGTTA